MKLKSKRVLVTGADGFIGSHLTEALVGAGCRVRAFVYYNSFNSLGWLDAVPKSRLKGVEVFAGDIRDPSGVREAVKDMDAVFHLAALIGIPFSYHSPDSYVDTNIRGTLNILQASRDLELERVICTSTSEVYGTAMHIPIDEEHPLRAQSPYSATKIAADKLAESFHLSFGLPVAIVRPFNTYGPRQSARAVIPTVIIQALSGYDSIHLGSTHPRRDLVFIDDTVKGFIKIAEADRAVGEVINIATGHDLSIGELAQKIIDVTGSSGRIVKDKARIRPPDSEVDRLLGSNAKLKKICGWVPKNSLDEGIRNTVEWFREGGNLKRYKAGIYNV